MKINSLHQKLNSLDIKREEFFAMHGFQFAPDNYIEQVIGLFKKGYWSLAPFAFSSSYNYSIRLTPGLNVQSSPIYYRSVNDAIMLAPNISSFVPFFNLTDFKQRSFIENEVLNNWEDFSSLLHPVLESLNAEDSLQFMHSYISKKENLDKLDKEGGYENLYRSFWNEYNASTEQIVYDQLMSKLITDHSYFPEINDIKCGIWNNRIAAAIASKACGKLKTDFHDLQHYYWLSLIQPHGFDSIDGSFDFIPNSSENTYWTATTYAEKFDPNPHLDLTFADDILSHPLFEASQEIRIKGELYLGEKHIEAAKVLDIKHNNPIAAWNALVTASYWAGKNGSQAIEPIWEAAIYLSEKESWNEISKILIDQYDFYNTFKEK